MKEKIKILGVKHNIEVYDDELFREKVENLCSLLQIDSSVLCSDCKSLGSRR